MRNASTDIILTAFITALFVGPVSVISSFYILRFLNIPDFRINTSICIPSQMNAFLVNSATGEKQELPLGIPFPFTINFQNTGNKALRNFDLFIEFSTDKRNFTTQNDTISTTPEKGFGKITIYQESAKVRRIHVELFNPGDQIGFNTFGNFPATVITYSKVEGLSYYSEIAPRCY